MIIQLKDVINMRRFSNGDIVEDIRTDVTKVYTIREWRDETGPKVDIAHNANGYPRRRPVMGATRLRAWKKAQGRRSI